MTDEDDCSAIENELRKLPGAKFLEVKCDLQNGTVNVTYDSMSVALKNLEFAVSQAGFDAGPYRAVEKNKFPEKR